jgi:hypothetical protein
MESFWFKQFKLFKPFKPFERSVAVEPSEANERVERFFTKPTPIVHFYRRC